MLLLDTRTCGCCKQTKDAHSQWQTGLALEYLYILENATFPTGIQIIFNAPSDFETYGLVL